MPLVPRWIIEINHGTADRPSWDIAGTVVGPRSASGAIESARASIPGIAAERDIRATPWDDAPEEQQEAAAYEDEIDGRAFGGALGRTGLPNQPTAWQRDYAAGRLPMWANTPARGCLYATLGFMWGWLKVIAVLAVLVFIARACFH